MSAALIESARLNEAAAEAAKSGKRMKITLITPGFGSSGYYSETVLKKAAADKVFPKGKAMYVNHQTHTEANDRVYGERSMQEFAARLAEDAYWDDNAQGLVAEADCFGPWRPVLAEMADHIGVSIRAFGTAEAGEVEGRQTMVIQSLDYAESVDFVPEAGRGGKITALLESARSDGKEFVEGRNVGGWLEARLHERFTCLADDMYGDGYLTREERIALSSAVGDALRAFVSRVDSDAPQLFARDLWVTPGPAPVAAAEANTTPKGALVAENNEGAPPVGGAADNAATPVDMAEAAKRADERVKALETELAEARESARLASDQSVQLAEANRRLREANERIVRLEGAEAARFAVAEAFKTANLPAAALARVTATVVGLNGNALPLTEGQVDRTKLKGAIDNAILAESEYVASINASAGAGQVRGMGSKAEMTEAAAQDALSSFFNDLGLGDDVAKIAAKGR